MIYDRVKAEYRQTNNAFSGNPLYQAVPSNEELLEKFSLLGNMPYIDDNVRNTYSMEEKLNLLDEIDEAIFLLPRYFRTFDMINRLIKTGYWYRNPTTKEYIRELDKLGREFQLQTFDYHFKYEQNGNAYAANGSKIMSMFGVIGTGKTTVLKEISNLYPASILHEEYEGERFRFLQIPIIKIKCPSECTLQTICCSFFDEVDNLTGTNYRARFGGSTRDIGLMLNRMRAVGALYGIGLFIIDELQDLIDSKQDTSQVKTFISQLSNIAGFPVLLAGTVNAKALFTTGSSKRRIVSGGEDTWDSMKEGDDEWEYVLKQLWSLRLTKNDSDIIPKEINKALFLSCQGILDFLKTIFVDAQRIALENQEKKLTVEIIAKSLESHPTILEMVSVIKDKKVAILSEMGDLIMGKNNKRNNHNKEYLEKINETTKILLDNEALETSRLTQNVVSCIRELEVCNNLTKKQLETMVGGIIRNNREEPFDKILHLAIESSKLKSLEKSSKIKENEQTEVNVNTKKKDESYREFYLRKGYIEENL